MPASGRRDIYLVKTPPKDTMASARGATVPVADSERPLDATDPALPSAPGPPQWPTGP